MEKFYGVRIVCMLEVDQDREKENDLQRTEH